MRQFAISSAVFASGVLLLYAVPTLLQAVGLKFGYPWLFCVVLSDVVGCLFLLALGLTRIAIITYLALSLAEGILLTTGWPPARLLVLTNVIPAVAASLVFATRFHRELLLFDRNVKGKPW